MPQNPSLDFPSVESRSAFSAAAFALLALSAAAFLFHYVLWGAYLRAETPAPYLGELPSIFANDIVRLMATSVHFSPYENIRLIFPFEAVPYPPAAFLLHGLLAKLGTFGGFAVFYGVLITGYGRLLWAEAAALPLWERLIAALAFTFGAYPFFYVFDRGNLDGLMALAVWAALYLYAKKPQGSQWLPAFLIGAAGALKIYPLFFALLFLQRRNFKAFALAGASCLIVTLLSMAALHGSFADQVYGFLNEIKVSNVCFASPDSCLNLSFVYPLKKAVQALTGLSSAAVFKIAYLISVLSLLGLVAAVIFFLKPPYPVAVALLSVAAIWIPVMSFDYKLLLLIPPVLMLLKDARPSFLLLALLLGASLVSKRAIGGWGTSINQVFLFAAFALCLVLSHAKGVRFADAFAPRATKMLFIALLFGFAFMYAWKTAQIARVPGLKGGNISLSMSKKDPRGAFGPGWSSFESDGASAWRWTAGCEGEIHLKMNPASNYRLKAVVQTHAANVNQTVSLFLNGFKIGDSEIAPGGIKEIVIDIPKERLMKETILPDRLVFKTSVCNPPAPQATPLGIAVSKIEAVRID